MAPASSVTTSVAPTITSAQAETRPSSTGAAAAGPAPDSMPGTASAVPAPSRSKDATDGQPSASYNTAPDGRVRNPVPSKLKGMADNRNGNFGVMHMDLTKPETSARDAAAKRTSESTAAAAKRANRNGYQSVKRSQLAWRPSDPMPPSQAPPSASSTPQDPFPYPPPSASASSSVPAHRQPPADSPVQPGAASVPGGLPSHVTKTEQARLLTLLRSLHPVLVVDQLCKALAYFGGIPGAPPPADGKFPESAITNGQGSLFVGWLAEIFPPVDGSANQGVFPSPPSHPSSGPANTVPTTDVANAANPTVPPTKRSRGRPKGSKSSKVRKDKGTKKKVNKDVPNAPQLEAATAVQITDTAEMHATTAPADQPIAQDTPGGDAAIQATAQPRRHAFPAVHNDQAVPDTTITGTPGSKKRGRPKGSKNRPKPASDTPAGPSTGPSLPMTNMSTHPQSSPLAQKSGPVQSTVQGTTQGNIDTTAPATPTTPRVEHTPQQNANLSPASFALFNNIGGQQPSNMPANAVKKSRQGSAGGVSGEGGFRKRKAGQVPPAKEQNSRASTATPASHELQHPLGAPTQAVSPAQTVQNKRRRMSKEASQARISIGTEAPISSTQPSSPPNPTTSFSGSVQSVSSTGSFESHNPVERLPAVRTTARFGPNQRLQRQQQQKAQAQPQQKHASGDLSHNQTQQQQQQQQQRSPNLARASQSSQPSQQGNMEASGNSQARQQHPNFFAVAPSNRSPQTYYAQQRQPVTPYGHLSNAGNSFGLGLSNSQSSSQFPQSLTKHNSGEAGMADSSHQGVVAMGRGKQTAEGARRPGYANTQSPRSSSGPSPGVNQFDYGDGNYLNMDYVINGQNATNTANAAAAAFGGGSSMDETLGEPSMRNRIY